MTLKELQITLDALSSETGKQGDKGTGNDPLPVSLSPCLDRWWLLDMDDSAWAAAEANVAHLARHVDIVARWRDAQLLTTLLAHAISENPPTLFDCYLPAEMPPEPGALRDWRAALPYSPGYRDCVAVYRLCRRIYSTTSNPNANKTASRSS